MPKKDTEIQIGQKVRWHDPGILDYDPEDRKYAISRVFTVTDYNPETGFACIQEEGGGTYAEVWDSELEII